MAKLFIEEGSRTPWGPAQHVAYPQEGIFIVSTAGHGGVKLDRKRNSLVPKAARAKGGWYEEDCQASIPACVFKLGDPVAQRESIRYYQTPEVIEALGC